MLILTIRTDKPEAEIGLFQDARQLAYEIWPAHRQLAETIHVKIGDLLESQRYTLTDLDGVAAYQGPGSFTGLRIGISVANALADGLIIPIVAAEGGRWAADAVARLEAGENQGFVLPEYGSPPHVTKPKH